MNKQGFYFIIVWFLIFFLACCSKAEKNPFWGDGQEKFEVQTIFEGGRFPNVVVAMDGSIIATWGSNTFQVKRSEDGGDKWGPVITVADPGFHGGGVTVDKNSGAIFAFVDIGHPPRNPQKTMGPLKVYSSEDHGKSWKEVDVIIHPDENGNFPAMHMSERGLTLRYGSKAGRMIRPARVYGRAHPQNRTNYLYNTAIYSDDNGKTWYTSAPFPAEGTGEGALEELSDGRIYYNSRRHWAPEGVDARRRWSAMSYDGGETWEDLSVSEELPDGAQHSDYGLMGGLVRLPLDDHDILLFSNIDSPEGRHSGTIWASFDGGKTWPVKRLVEDGGFAYSSMAAGRKGTPGDGWIYLMYEGGNPYGYAYMARFNLAWVTGGRDWREFIRE